MHVTRETLSAFKRTCCGEGAREGEGYGPGGEAGEWQGKGREGQDGGGSEENLASGCLDSQWLSEIALWEYPKIDP